MSFIVPRSEREAVVTAIVQQRHTERFERDLYESESSLLDLVSRLRQISPNQVVVEELNCQIHQIMEVFRSSIFLGKVFSRRLLVLENRVYVLTGERDQLPHRLLIQIPDGTLRAFPKVSLPQHSAERETPGIRQFDQRYEIISKLLDLVSQLRRRKLNQAVVEKLDNQIHATNMMGALFGAIQLNKISARRIAGIGRARSDLDKRNQSMESACNIPELAIDTIIRNSRPASSLSNASHRKENKKCGPGRA